MGAPRSAPDGRNGSSIWDSRHVMDGFSRVNSFKLRTTLSRNLLTNEHFCVDIMRWKRCERRLWLFMFATPNSQAQCMIQKEIRGSPATKDEKKAGLQCAFTPRLTDFNVIIDNSQQAGQISPVPYVVDLIQAMTSYLCVKHFSVSARMC